MGNLVVLLVIGTTIWVYFDAKALGAGKIQAKGLAGSSPLKWSVACGLLWIVFFPIYLATRSKIKMLSSEKPNSVLTKCPDCNTEISINAKACPKCGAIRNKKGGFLKYAGIGVLVLFSLGVIGAMMSKKSTESSTPKAGFSMPSFGEQTVTYDEYTQIENGMDYEYVVEIIGAKGQEISRADNLVMYQWVNDNGSNMNATFERDSLIAKAQMGLD